MKKLLLALCTFISIGLGSGSALAQCNGVFPANTSCGSVAGGIPGPVNNSILVGNPGGTSGQTQYNNTGAFGGYTPGGDCTVVTATGVFTCLKTNGVSYGPFATASAASATAALNLFSSTLQGLAPASGGGTINFLRADATWAPITATTITYTAPGTGGTAQTITNRLQKTLYLTDYGPACDGTTDDAVPMQNMINEAQTLGPRTTATINCIAKIGTSLVITSPFRLTGTGMTEALLLCVPTIICIDKQMGVGTNGMFIGNFSIQYTSAANAGTAAIRQRSTATHQVIYDQFENMFIFFAFNGFDIDGSNSYRVTNIEFNTLGNNGMNLANTSFPDAGNGVIQSIQCVSVQACVQWASGGGLHLNNMVVSGVAVNGLVVALAAGANTSDIFVNNSQLEGCTGAGILLFRQSTTGSLKLIRVSGTEFESHIAVQIPNDATGPWITGAVFTDNQWLGDAVAGAGMYFIDSLANFQISGGSAISQVANSVLVQAGAAATNGYVSNIPNSGSFAAMAFAAGSSITLDWSLPNVVFASLPVGARDGSRVYITNGTTASAPCTGGGTGALAHHQAGAWKCF